MLGTPSILYVGILYVLFSPPNVAIGPAPHRVSRALRARNPGRVQKESGKSSPGQGPKSAQRVRPEVSKESKKSPKIWF